MTELKTLVCCFGRPCVVAGQAVGWSFTRAVIRTSRNFDLLVGRRVGRSSLRSCLLSRFTFDGLCNGLRWLTLSLCTCTFEWSRLCFCGCGRLSELLTVLSWWTECSGCLNRLSRSFCVGSLPTLGLFDLRLLNATIRDFVVVGGLGGSFGLRFEFQIFGRYYSWISLMFLGGGTRFSWNAARTNIIQE